MKRPPLPKVPCFACGVEIRRARPTWAVCAECWKLAEAAFTRTHPYTDPITWSRDRNAFFTDRTAVLAAIESERASLVGAA